MRTPSSWIGFSALIAVLLLALAACSSDDAIPRTVLVWNDPVISVSVAAGGAVIVEFTYPNDGSGWPSLQFITVTGGTVDAYMCEVSTCNPANAIAELYTTITGAITGDQVYVSGDPGAVKTYWIYITSASSVTMELQATGT